METEKIEMLFKEYPKLEGFITAGQISLKCAREILGIDRKAMYSVFLELIEYKAVNSCGNTGWRATPEFKKWMEGRL